MDFIKQTTMYRQMKHLLIVALLCAVSTSLFAQDEKRLEHGVMVGAGAGFPLQDGWKMSDYGDPDNWTYRHDYKLNSMVGYRFRFLPERRFFYDLDLTMGFQKMETTKYFPYMSANPDNSGYVSGDNTVFDEFVMPISVAASWNWRFAKRFHVGVGVAPTLYVSPRAVFDLPVMAKVGYRLGKRCELSLSYQYGCLNTLKRFNDGPSNGRRGHLSDLMLSVYIPLSLR